MFGFGKVNGGFNIGGISVPRHPNTPNELVDLTTKLAPQIAKRVRSDQDLYWFIIEQFDRLYGKSEYFNEILDSVGLHVIEYKGMRSEQSYVGKPNPGVTFFQREIIAPLSAVYDQNGVDYSSVVIFSGFCQTYKTNVKAARNKYGTHYHNNCISQGNFNSADRWVEVLDSL
jgi:hypothetical protein